MSSPQQRQPMPLSPGVISPTWNGDWFVVLCTKDHRADRVTLVARWLTIHTKIRPNILGRIFVQTTAHTLRGSTNIRPKYQRNLGEANDGHTPACLCKSIEKIEDG